MLSCRGTSEMWFDVMNMYGDLGMTMSVLSLIAIILYFVTSSDSGSLVIDCLSANGNLDPPIIQRIFWSLTEGATATALLVAGGKDSLEALQTVSVACGLPITLFLNWSCVALWRAVREEAGDIGILEGRWQLSMWSLNNRQRLVKSLVSILFPWYYLAQAKLKLENNTLLRYMFFYSILYGTPFYMVMVSLIAEFSVKGMTYIAWATFVFFCVFGGSLRGEVRERYRIEGDAIEDTFSFILVYPIAVMQIHEQVQQEALLTNDFELQTMVTS